MKSYEIRIEWEGPFSVSKIIRKMIKYSFEYIDGFMEYIK